MHRAIRFLTLCSASALAFSAAADRNSTPSVQKQLQDEERALCMKRPQEDRSACLREIGAARQEAKRGRLDEGQSANYEKNRIARCSYLSGDDKALCERRMRGEGTTSGSVEGGGIYRELVTREPAQ
jgi:hypothetical protein